MWTDCINTRPHLSSSSRCKIRERLHNTQLWTTHPSLACVLQPFTMTRASAKFRVRRGGYHMRQVNNMWNTPFQQPVFLKRLGTQWWRKFILIQGFYKVLETCASAQTTALRKYIDVSRAVQAVNAIALQMESEIGQQCQKVSMWKYLKYKKAYMWWWRTWIQEQLKLQAHSRV